MKSGNYSLIQRMPLRYLQQESWDSLEYLPWFSFACYNFGTTQKGVGGVGDISHEVENPITFSFESLAVHDGEEVSFEKRFLMVMRMKMSKKDVSKDSSLEQPSWLPLLLVLRLVFRVISVMDALGIVFFYLSLIHI